MTAGLINCRWSGRGVAAAAALLLAAERATVVLAAAPEPPRPADVPPRVVPEQPQDLLGLDHEIQRFFASRVSARAHSHARLEQIVRAILEPDGLGFQYDVEATFAPRDAFAQRRGNCASFAFLVVALAREFGFEASFQSVQRAGRWSREGDVVLSVAHLNVLVTTMDGDYVVDLAPELSPPGTRTDVQQVRDETACARFYCNIGVEHLVRGDSAEALRFMVLATAADPQCSTAWSNRAAVNARRGDLQEAKRCYEHALRLRSSGEPPLDGLVDVLRRLGTPEDLRRAGQLARRADAIRRRNPYFQEYLASRAYEQHDLAGAERALRRAIKLKADEPAFYAQWITVLEALGRPDDARRAARKLEQLRTRLAAPPPPLIH